jgi:O-methyltransferase involved in polyketide biosynthesis
MWGMFRRRAQGSKRTDGPVGDGLGAANGHEPGPAAGDRHSGEAADAGLFGHSEAMGSLGAAPAGVDASVPHPARIWNYWLGGRDYFAADRAAGHALDQEFPHVAQIARAERAFLVRAVRFLAGPARMRQFLDIGAGLPAGGNTHEIAQRIAPDSGIVYADHDQVVLVHARALLASPMLASSPEGVVSYIEADLRDVAAVLAGSARTLDHARPVALMMLGVLGYIDDYGTARSIASQLMDALPAGSYLAIADGVATAAYVDSMQQRYNQSAPMAYRLQRPDELASFFDGLDLVEPGVVPCPEWKPDVRSADGAAQGPAVAYCGVARKP